LAAQESQGGAAAPLPISNPGFCKTLTAAVAVAVAQASTTTNSIGTVNARLNVPSSFRNMRRDSGLNLCADWFLLQFPPSGPHWARVRI
jgi:hypothetical protein